MKLVQNTEKEDEQQERQAEVYSKKKIKKIGSQSVYNTGRCVQRTNSRIRNPQPRPPVFLFLISIRRPRMLQMMSRAARQNNRRSIITRSIPRSSSPMDISPCPTAFFLADQDPLCCRLVLWPLAPRLRVLLLLYE